MATPQANVLFIDDDADVRKTAELLLRKAGFVFHGAATPEEGLSRLVANPIDVVLLDLNFERAQTSGEEGLACLADVLRHDPQAIVIVVTGYSGLSVAVRAVKAGARDVVMKPWNNERLVDLIKEAVASRRPAATSGGDPSIIAGTSNAMHRIKATIDRFAPLNAPVLLTGDPGTGKSLAATTLHRKSGRTELISQEAVALTPEGLADRRDTTLIIENIERLPENLVSTLMNWLKAAPRQNSRLVTTSARSRADLGLERGVAYALSTLEILMPPLAERPEDIVPLALHFARIACQQNGLREKTFNTDAQAALTAQAWTDNIHALRYVVERSVLLSEAPVLGVTDLALETADGGLEQAAAKPRLADSEKTLIEEALKRNNFNVTAAASQLGLTRPALYRRMSKHGL